MTTARLISVAEMNYQSDRLAMEMHSINYVSGKVITQTMVVSVTSDQNLQINLETTTQKPGTNIVHNEKPVELRFNKLNISALIEFLNESKVFISEELAFRKLRGNK